MWLCCLTALISPKMFDNYKQDNTSINPVINPVIKYCWVDNTYMFLGTDILFENLYKKIYILRNLLVKFLGNKTSS